jgi:hypothetical protein
MLDTDNDRGIEELRRVILGAERKTLSDLDARVSDPHLRAADVAEVLPQAIALGTQRDPRLVQSLQQPLDDCIKASVRKNPRSIADALFPIIGPAIRKSIAQTLKEFVQSVNEALEQGFSAQGLRWRWESWRTGRPFGEVVLRNTVHYRVEQVFLIHNGSGLLVEHVGLGEVIDEDTDAFSAMLTAIQDFVRDSFSKGKEQDIHTVETGERVIWIIPGPYAYLAGVIWGAPPLELKHTLESTLEEIHGTFGAELEPFDGDRTSFIGVDAILGRALLSKRKTTGGTTQNVAWVEKLAEGRCGALRFSPPMIVVTVALVAALAYFTIASVLEQRRLDELIAGLRAEPGIAVLTVERDDGVPIIRALRDPLATDPQVLVQSAGMDPADVRIVPLPYRSLDPHIVERRVRSLLDVPDTVAVRLEGDTLYLTGAAPLHWVESVSAGSAATLGIDRIDLTALSADTGGSLRLLHERLRAAPGIVVIDLLLVDGVPVVRGLADALAEEPERYAIESGFAPGTVRFELSPFRSMKPALVLERARRHLHPPESVQLSLEGSTLVVSGYASREWLRQATQRVAFSDGLDALEQRDLIVAADSVQARLQAILEPPPGVTVELDGEVLRVRGSASREWIERARSRLDAQIALPSYDLRDLHEDQKDLPAR